MLAESLIYSDAIKLSEALKNQGIYSNITIGALRINPTLSQVNKALTTCQSFNAAVVIGGVSTLMSMTSNLIETKFSDIEKKLRRLLIFDQSPNKSPLPISDFARNKIIFNKLGKVSIEKIAKQHQLRPFSIAYLQVEAMNLGASPTKASMIILHNGMIESEIKGIIQ